MEWIAQTRHEDWQRNTAGVSWGVHKHTAEMLTTGVRPGLEPGKSESGLGDQKEGMLETGARGGVTVTVRMGSRYNRHEGILKG